MKLILVVALLLALLNAEILPFDNTAIEKIFQQKTAALFLFIADDEAEAEALAAFQQLDQTNPEVILTLSRKNDGHGLFDRLAEYLGVDTASTPRVLYLGAKSEKYNFDGEAITGEALASFVTRVQSGKVDPFLKSAPIPESNDEAVRVVVGKNFKQVVLDSHQEVLVEFYAPWCGHCKHLAPHFEEAAQRISNNPNILIAKVDSTENEVAGIDIQGFPTLKFWGKDKTAEPIDYNGERTADGIVQWLKEHTSYDWVEPTGVEVEEPIVDESL